MSRTLAKAFSVVVEYYLNDPDNHVHAAISLTCDDIESEGPVKHFAYVEHADHQRELLATFIPKFTDEGLQWITQKPSPDCPVYLINHFKARGFGPKRFHLEEATAAFEAHAKKHHPAQHLEFIGTAPGRIVVRLCSPDQPSRPYGIILDARAIRGERVIMGETNSDSLFGIDIHG
jgi:hypothetical protein